MQVYKNREIEVEAVAADDSVEEKVRRFFSILSVCECQEISVTYCKLCKLAGDHVSFGLNLLEEGTSTSDTREPKQTFFIARTAVVTTSLAVTLCCPCPCKRNTDNIVHVSAVRKTSSLRLQVESITVSDFCERWLVNRVEKHELTVCLQNMKRR
jgi:hypothetical protein